MSAAVIQEERSGKVQDWTLLGRLLELLLPYSMRVAASVVCALADMALQVLGPLVISVAVDRYFLNRGPSKMLPLALPADPQRGLTVLSLAYLAMLILSAAVQALQNYWANWTGEKAMADLRSRLFAHLQRLEISFFDTNPVGRLVTRITTDVESLSEMFSGGIVGISANLVMVIFFLAAMMRISPWLTVILAVILPVFVLITILFRRVVTPTQQRVRILIARINAMLAEHINGVAVLQLFNREDLSRREFDTINHQHKTASVGWITANSWFLPYVELMGTISQAGLIFAGASLLNGGRLTVGTLVAFLQYGAKFLRPIQDLSERYGILQTSVVSADRVFRLLDTPAAKPNPCASRVAPPEASIEFDHVWFAYQRDNQGDNWVLRDVSFRIAPGQSLAVVGHTGAGKTTLANLLLRFYEPQRGTIRLGGADIRSIAPAALRARFGIVLQDTYVHQGSILDNIHFGMESNGKEAAHAAARHVQFEDVAGSLADGLETHVAERGANLSAGQRQLIGFARALCRDPQLLILDEATSDIDIETEAKIQRALAGLLQGRTSLIIAHRLTTVLRADRILVMHKGEVREFGTHAELVAHRGLYWRLYQLQFGSISKQEVR